MKNTFVEPLLEWFDENKRDLPWRKNRNPYEIWISEIMLQQTRVEAVLGYYRRFLEKLPDVKSLAECPEDELLKLWEGLGYYSRARNLKKGALQVMEDYEGRIPTRKNELIKLSGIGSYTAAAIASQAFEEPVAAVDGNVLRVYSRFFEDGRDIGKEKTKRDIENRLNEIMPRGRSGDFNQGMMELGALVCVPNGAPKCERCPIREHCLSYKNGSWESYPYKEAKKARRVEEKTILLLCRDQKVLIRKRDNKGLLAGLYEFPNMDGHQTKRQVLEYVKKMGLHPLQMKEVGEGKHIFSHVEWHMKGFEIKIDEIQEIPQDCLFINRRDLVETYSIPSAFGVYRTYITEKLKS